MRWGIGCTGDIGRAGLADISADAMEETATARIEADRHKSRPTCQA